ncbi:MAG: hypothetical protein K0Q59_2428 [Paenibacillus sp.]|jgi:hypothetical protein|nr:hypothetical protein [Paenibacillus sp.]
MPKEDGVVSHPTNKPIAAEEYSFHGFFDTILIQLVVPKV